MWQHNYYVRLAAPLPVVMLQQSHVLTDHIALVSLSSLTDLAVGAAAVTATILTRKWGPVMTGSPVSRSQLQINHHSFKLPIEIWYFNLFSYPCSTYSQRKQYQQF